MLIPQELQLSQTKKSVLSWFFNRYIYCLLTLSLGKVTIQRLNIPENQLFV